MICVKCGQGIVFNQYDEQDFKPRHAVCPKVPTFNPNTLKNGLYRLHWKDGRSSLAAVGRLHNGKPWFAPVNWVSASETGIASQRWELIDRAERIEVERPSDEPTSEEVREYQVPTRYEVLLQEAKAERDAPPLRCTVCDQLLYDGRREVDGRQHKNYDGPKFWNYHPHREGENMENRVKSADLIRDYQELVTGKPMDFRCKRCKTPLSVNGQLMSLACGCLKSDECLVDIVESYERETADVAAPEQLYKQQMEYRKEQLADYQTRINREFAEDHKAGIEMVQADFTIPDVVLSVLFFIVGDTVFGRLEKFTADPGDYESAPKLVRDCIGSGAGWMYLDFDQIRADCQSFVERLESDAPLPRLERRDGYYLFVRHKGGGGEVWRERYLEEVEEMAGVKIPIYSPHSFTSSFTEISVRACEDCGIVPEPQAYNVYRWEVRRV